MAKVDVEATLLKQYSDKDLIRYIKEELDKVLHAPSPECYSLEADCVERLSKLEPVYVLVKAVDKRMNGDSKNTNIVL